MTRAEAAQAVVNIGGSVGNGVTKKTDFLVVGSTDYCASVKGGKTGKLKKAEDLQKKGASLAIIDEGAFTTCWASDYGTTKKGRRCRV